MNNNEFIVFGLDLSLNHFGIVSITFDGEQSNIDCGCMTDSKKFYKAISKDIEGYYLPIFNRKKEDRPNFEARRRTFVLRCVNDYICSQMRRGHIDYYVAIEDYAFTTRSRSSYQMGEVGGLVRGYLYEAGYKLRTYDPLSIKLWATGRGNCLKKDMVESAENSGFKIAKGLLEQDKKKAVYELKGVGTDLADAYHLAMMLLTEILIRKGERDFRDLTEGQRRVFLRVTPANKINILDKPFICIESK